MTPSVYQQAVYDWTRQALDTPNANLVIQAVAGSGKTTTAVKQTHILPPGVRALSLAFNKSIALELGNRLPANVAAKTMNAVGHAALSELICTRNGWGREVSWKLTNLTSDKINMLKRRHLSRMESEDFGREIGQLVGLAKASGVAPPVPGIDGLLPDDDAVYLAIIDAMALDIPDRDQLYVVGKAREMMLDNWRLAFEADYCEQFLNMVGAREKHHRALIDFDDQLYLSVLGRANFPAYEWVWVDEAQDTSPIQHAMLKRLRRPGGHLVAIGDSRQAIYQFRGADSSSMDKLVEAFNADELPLSVCYRCCRAVVREAQPIVPHIEAAPNATEGQVQRVGVYTAKNFTAGDMVVCRNTAPVVAMAYKLIAQGVGAYVMGRDIGKGLIALIEKLKPKGIRGEFGLEAKLMQWRMDEIEKLQRKGHEDRIQLVDDKYDTLMTFIERSQCTTVPDIQRAIEAMFSDKDGDASVTLCTIHKSKGLERDRVWFLDPDLIGKRAKTPDQVEAENNLKYVAITRARSALFYIASENFATKEVPAAPTANTEPQEAEDEAALRSMGG